MRSLGIRVVVFLALAAPAAPAALGPLRVSDANPRYFATPDGRVVYLTGSHTWNNLVDMGTTDPPPQFDYAAYLDFMERRRHNFMRMWAWDLTKWDTERNGQKEVHTVAPQPWARTGPGTALDGKPKFNLEQFDPPYFERLRTRVAAAGDRGIYVSIMLFEGWGMQFVKDAWKSHPLHPGNNVNGIGGDIKEGVRIHELASKPVLAVQEAYVRKVIDTVNDLDNVLYEISNENHPPSTDWQYHIIRLIHDYEKTKPKQHPVGMTFQYQGGSNETLFESPAEWVSPNPGPKDAYRNDPPAAAGRKVILTDTDHLWGLGGNQAWVWKSFARGMNPLFMDPYEGKVLGGKPEPKWDPVRNSLGYTLALARRIDLARITPRNELASTQYCLANPGAEYVVYNPSEDNAAFEVNLEAGAYQVEWINPDDGKTVATGDVEAKGGPTRFEAPFKGDAVLHLKRAAR